MVCESGWREKMLSSKLAISAGIPLSRRRGETSGPRGRRRNGVRGMRFHGAARCSGCGWEAGSPCRRFREPE